MNKVKNRGLINKVKNIMKSSFFCFIRFNDSSFDFSQVAVEQIGFDLDGLEFLGLRGFVIGDLT